MNGAAALPLAIQHQLQTDWCWAACSSSTSTFFDGLSPWTQCGLANAELDQSTCCGDDGSTEACNQPWYVDRALTRTGNLAARAAGQAAWEQVKGEIDAGRPICARIGWREGGGHFVLITGYYEAGTQRGLDIEDPWTGSASVELDQFANSYQTLGSWTHTYFTRA
jgi:hypothetical protein